MTTAERFRTTMDFGKPDRIPCIEWASWWDKTIDRWRGEGLEQDPRWTGELFSSFGLDRHDQFWISAIGPDCPPPPSHGAPRIRSAEEFRALLPRLYPNRLPDREGLERAAEIRAKGDTILWMTLDGFFWFPRDLLGIEPHLYAFYDEKDLMREINDRLADWMLETVERVSSICVPDFMTFAEDLSYNLGPMISRECFDEFLRPCYERVVPELKKRGIRVIVDSDGDISEAIPWFIDAGIEGVLPLERQAGVDVGALRERFPKFLFIGGFDKMVMPKGEEAMRAEFERLLPAMRKGGFIPSVDHQTPPGVSLENYRIYVSLLLEYCGKAL
jgi:hypothetical protein